MNEERRSAKVRQERLPRCGDCGLDIRFGMGEAEERGLELRRRPVDAAPEQPGVKGGKALRVTPGCVRPRADRALAEEEGDHRSYPLHHGRDSGLPRRLLE